LPAFSLTGMGMSVTGPLTLPKSVVVLIIMLAELLQAPYHTGLKRNRL
jgi:hypothetical protein